MSEPVQVTVVIQSTAPWVAVVVTIGPALGGGIGPVGPAGPVATLSRRHAYAAPHSYCGRAPAGTAEADEQWTITRITVAANGSVTLATASGVAWSDNLTATYA